MANTILANDVLSTLATIDVYTFPSSGKINSFVITNQTSTRQTIDVYVDLIMVRKFILPAGQGQAMIIPELIGSYGLNSVISVRAYNANTISYLITGWLDA